MIKEIEDKIAMEFDREKTKNDFICWVDESLKILKDKKISHEQQSCSKVVKKLTEEAYPIKLFLNSWEGDAIISISLIKGDRNYDALMKTQKGKIYLEVTCPKDGNKEHYARKVLDKHGLVFSNVTIQEYKDSLEKQILPRGNFSNVTDAISVEFQSIYKAIEKKSNKNYQNNTLLIVATSCIAFNCKEKFTSFCSNLKNNFHPKIKKFLGIYLVNLQLNKCKKIQ